MKIGKEIIINDSHSFKTTLKNINDRVFEIKQVSGFDSEKRIYLNKYDFEEILNSIFDCKIDVKMKIFQKIY